MLLGIFTTANVTTNCPNTSDLLAVVLGGCDLSGEQPTIASKRIKSRKNFIFRNYLRIDALSSFPSLPSRARPFHGVALPPAFHFRLRPTSARQVGATRLPSPPSPVRRKLVGRAVPCPPPPATNNFWSTTTTPTK